MTARNKISWLGVGVIAFAAFILIVGIPYGVNSPTNVDIIFLSPKFWPVIIACALALLGVLMILERFFSFPSNSGGADKADDASGTQEGAIAPWMRLVAMAGLMAALIIAIPIVGMVWATMICFGLFAIIVRSRRPIETVIVAVVLPLVLYAFFNHIAGVAVPQGEFIRLP